MKKITWALGVTMGIAGASALFQLVACSSDSTQDDAGPGKDSGKTDTGAGDGGNNPDTGTPDGGGCSLLGLFPNPDAGPYCPFQAGGDGGIFANCPTGEHCCLYGSQTGVPSTCNPAQTACLTPDAGPNGYNRDWQCNENDDCPQSQVCCLSGKNISPDKLCPTTSAFTSGVLGSVCKASCNTLADGGAGNEVQMCQKQDCPGNTTCHTFKITGVTLGVCL